MAEGARRGRPPRLTRETVARAVLEVGFPQLTFTAVRERLGVGESTLFRYAPDRDELVRLGLGLAMESVEMPPRQGRGGRCSPTTPSSPGVSGRPIPVRLPRCRGGFSPS